MKTVLIVDDELDIQSSLGFALKDEGYKVVTATLPKEAEKILAEEDIDLALLDVWFPEGDGIELLTLVREKYPNLIPIMMSGHGNIELALKSIRMGAYDFLEKPLELEKVLVVLKNATDTLKLREENRRLRTQYAAGDLTGLSPAIVSLRTSVQKAAQASSHLLLMGENGTGKERVARLIHDWSPRKDRPFVAVNCAAVPEGLVESEFFGHEKGSFTGAIKRAIGRLESAENGTLFLDEIGELSLAAQSKMLRVLEERQFERVGGNQTVRLEARIVAATNRDLAAEVKAGKFREDLYFRLNVLSITVPPLRNRAEDIPLLAEQFLNEISKDVGHPVPPINADLLEWFRDYDWPGNVRELRNLIERMVIMGSDRSQLSLADLPEELQGLVVPQSSLEDLESMDGSLRDLRAVFERQIIQKRLDKCSGNVTRTAETLGIERAHLHRKMKQYGVSAKE